jgi:hypothetical protein
MLEIFHNKFPLMTTLNPSPYILHTLVFHSFSLNWVWMEKRTGKPGLVLPVILAIQETEIRRSEV